LGHGSCKGCGGELAVGFEAIYAAFKLHVALWKDDDAETEETTVKHEYLKA
jgi:hypothetical protein